jgi:hypothetical protein
MRKGYANTASGGFDRPNIARISKSAVRKSVSRDGATTTTRKNSLKILRIESSVWIVRKSGAKNIPTI